MAIDDPITRELRELLRVLLVHPDVLKATVETKDGQKFCVKYPPGEGDERACYEVIRL